MKKLLLSLFVSFISLIGFGNCATNCLEPGNPIYNNSSVNYSNCESYQSLLVCAQGQAGMFSSSVGYSLNLQGFAVCYYVNPSEYVNVDSWGQDYMLFTYYPSIEEYQECEPCETCEDCSTWQDMYNQCQSSYNTLSGNYSSCESDLSTCQGNLSSCGNSLSSCSSDLSACLSGNVGTGEYNWSALFINNIQHLGKPIINITIPEEIDWDYTGNENSFDLTVKGYAVDSDYIQGIIDINSYQVTSEDFTDIFVNGLTLIFPYIIVVLFIVFIRKLVKKIFS